ncbi:MAG: hypothetical protein M1582_04845 [Actinobacteria bacterium]|nr:hypothetical protein [Actinomycetota bacterium]
MEEVESKEMRLEDEGERILTLKVNLEGPAELVSWIRENTPPRFRVGRRVGGFLPEDFRQHVRAARREQLLAVRSLLNAIIDRMMPEEEKPGKKSVEVEIE